MNSQALADHYNPQLVTCSNQSNMTETPSFSSSSFREAQHQPCLWSCPVTPGPMHLNENAAVFFGRIAYRGFILSSGYANPEIGTLRQEGHPA